jgi:hypothetical protein
VYVRPWTETAGGTLAEVLHIKLSCCDDSKFATAHARRGGAVAAAATAAIAEPLPSPIPFHHSSQSVCRASSRNRERPRTILTVPLV